MCVSVTLVEELVFLSKMMNIQFAQLNANAVLVLEINSDFGISLSVLGYNFGCYAFTTTRFE